MREKSLGQDAEQDAEMVATKVDGFRDGCSRG